MSQPNNTGEGKEKHSDRWHAAEEIVTSEYTYMNQLKFISDLKQTLLKSSSVDNEKVNKVFGNIESLYLISSNIYAKCDEEVRKHDNDYDKSNLGKVIGNLAAYLKLYTEYINCYKESLDIVADSSEKKDAFYNECEKAKKNMNVTMDLGSFLIMPVQRIPRYRLLLQRLLKYTPETNYDYQDIVNALSIIENIANLCDAAMLPDMNTIINQIHTSLGANINLINVRRKIKTQKEGTLVSFQSSLQVFLVYFNDILLIYTKQADQVKVLYIFEYLYTKHIVVLPEKAATLCYYDNEKSCNIKFESGDHMNENIDLFVSLKKQVKKHQYNCRCCNATGRDKTEAENDSTENVIYRCVHCHRAVCKECSTLESYYDLNQLQVVDGIVCKFCSATANDPPVDNHISAEEKGLPNHWQINQSNPQDPYYYNNILWKSTYRDPKMGPSSEATPLPFYWKKDFLNDDQCTPFYYNVLTEESQWEQPVVHSKSNTGISSDLLRVCLNCHKLYPDENTWQATCSCNTRLSFPYHFTPKEI